MSPAVFIGPVVTTVYWRGEQASRLSASLRERPEPGAAWNLPGRRRSPGASAMQSAQPVNSRIRSGTARAIRFGPAAARGRSGCRPAARIGPGRAYRGPMAAHPAEAALLTALTGTAEDGSLARIGAHATSGSFSVMIDQGAGSGIARSARVPARHLSGRCRPACLRGPFASAGPWRNACRRRDFGCAREEAPKRNPFASPGQDRGACATHCGITPAMPGGETWNG